MFKIADGERPARPDAHDLGLVDSVWDMTLRCWQQEPEHRPAGADVVRFLREWLVFLSLSINEHPETSAAAARHMLGARLRPLWIHGNRREM